MPVDGARVVAGPAAVHLRGAGAGVQHLVAVAAAAVEGVVAAAAVDRVVAPAADDQGVAGAGVHHVAWPAPWLASPGGVIRDRPAAGCLASPQVPADLQGLVRRERSMAPRAGC